jgi:tRNA-dihydrouridine synthase B
MNGIETIFLPERASLAPLAGITGSVFRRICCEFGARPVMTEMVSADGILHRGTAKKTARLLGFHESERPVGFQLFGSNPDVMAVAVKRVLEGEPDFIDINAGCPVKKVVGRGAGSALLRTPELLADIVAAVVTASSGVPVTVKIRSGWDERSINAVEVSRLCVEAGASAIIVHPRTRSQGFSGRSDWSVIRDVREAVAVPVIGSGDITTPEDAVAMLRETGCRTVMIGRRAMGNPWIFAQVRALLSGEEVPPSPDTAARLDLALRQLDMLAGEVSERFALLNMRKFFGWYSRGAREGAQFRQDIFKAESIDAVREIVAVFQEKTRESDIHTIDVHNPEMVEP